MPEGPECRHIAESLAKIVSNKTLTSIEALSGRYIKKLPKGAEQFDKFLPALVIGVGVHGKFIYWILDKELSIWNTLGMTGWWSDKRVDHSRLRLEFSDGFRVYFNDQRNFGTIKLVRGKHQLVEKLQSLGPDMLHDDVSDDVFIERLRKFDHWPITNAVMSQGIIAGVGNYIKADSLWLAKINPHRTVKEISDDELKILKKSIQDVMQESYQSGGATIRTYKKFDGDPGEYADKFLVYNRKQDPDGNPVIKEPTADGRTTHWAPAVQK